MRDLKKIVDEYLSGPTDYSIQIVGNWGHGKTYYYKKYLESLIKNKEIYNDPTKEYKPIYISLFGLKSTEDIATKIVIEFFESKFFKDYYKTSERRKKLRITEGILKIGLRGFLSFSRLGDVHQYLTDVKDVGKNVLATDELVLCFDDLERRDSALNVKDLTGYINSLLDEKVKVLLISNDDILKKDEKDYKDLQEKIVGITVDYSVNIKATIEEINDKKFAAFPAYQRYLKDNVDLLVEISEAAGNNFRHIIYGLNILHYFFAEFRKNIFDIHHEIAKKLQEQLGNIARMILGFAIEYKSSNVSFKDIDYFNNFSELFSIRVLSDHQLNITEKETSKLRLFLSKYKIDKNQYFFYLTIFKYVTFNDDFILKEFIIDFKDKFHLDNGQILPQYELVEELSPDNYFNLSDEEFLDKFEKIFEFVDLGIYKPEDHLSIVFLVQRFKEVFDINLEEACDRLVVGLKKSIQNAGSNYEVLFGRFRGNEKSSLYDEYQSKLYDIGVAEIKLYIEVKQRKRLNEIIDLFLKDYKAFQYRFRSEKYFDIEIAEIHFLNHISCQDFIGHIKRNDNGLIKFLTNFFKRRFNSIQQFEAESPAIVMYLDTLNQYSKELVEKKDYKIRKYLISELSKTLSEIIKKYEKK